ncbi:hypothetical protein [Mesorhizobium sp. B2-4-8]|uniref:hypothetical protein n=1 Tax=Mesorhizobium sp. B2-4-8 TaxID=2589941 RepID=UPI0015E35AFF|nr:hypothetical protein [Mesorhizobium sp. B2-4-8]
MELDPSVLFMIMAPHLTASLPGERFTRAQVPLASMSATSPMLQEPSIARSAIQRAMQQGLRFSQKAERPIKLDLRQLS